MYRKVYGGLKEGGVFILGDYIADCDEEEELLRGVYLKRRMLSGIPDDRFVHFDIPLTLEHEAEVLRDAGFVIKEIRDEPDGVTIFVAGKAASGRPASGIDAGAM